jgi:histidinol dehydrogenase
MNAPLLRRIKLSEIASLQRSPTFADTEQAAAQIVGAVRERGEPALREFATRFDGLGTDQPLQIDRDALERALASLDPDTRILLQRTAERIRAFALAQRASLSELTVPIPGGRAGHTVVPVARAGCYAPAGRYPLPSTLLMTAVTARAAGVGEVIVATPRPSPLMLATAAIAGADGVLAAGGAHAIAAMAYGVGVPACDIIVGPGNRWVTAAKRLVSGDVAIDMLAGPSELVVVADGTADPRLVAADLLAQAEHDDDALPVLVVIGGGIVEAVEYELASQLETLPTAETARIALKNGAAVMCTSRDEALTACDAIAPEHLQLSMEDATSFAARCRNAGALFIGERSAEVFGDYGVGGNHVLPFLYSPSSACVPGSASTRRPAMRATLRPSPDSKDSRATPARRSGALELDPETDGEPVVDLGTREDGVHAELRERLRARNLAEVHADAGGERHADVARTRLSGRRR